MFHLFYLKAKIFVNVLNRKLNKSHVFGIIKTKMRLIVWNLYQKEIDLEKIELLRKVINEDEIVVSLIGVKRETKEILMEAFPEYLFEHSLDKKATFEFSSKLREIGILFILSPSFTIKSRSTYPGALLDERTYVLELIYNKRDYKLLSFFSTGEEKPNEMKSIENLGFAELISILKPSMSLFSIPEPLVDNIDINKLVFQDNFDKGQGGRAIFQELKKSRNVDSFLEVNNKLPFSYINKKNKRLRHDFIYTSHFDVRIKESYYLYKEAVSVNSDHAIVVTICKLI